MMRKLDLSSPWQIYRQELAELSALDDAVTVGPVEGGDESETKLVTLEAGTAICTAALDEN